MVFGVADLPWWGYVLVTLLLTHVTIVAVTLYLHRAQTHRALVLHPVVSHFFRFWLWFTTGMVTREWVAIHRKHHARVETEEDPHSPQIRGIGKVLWWGAELYRAEYLNHPETVANYGQGTPDDWLERYVYGRGLVTYFGIMLMLLAWLVLFGWIGLTLWAVQMAWIPFFAAGVINGVGHWRGYRNFECPDASTNVFPIGVLIGGEELHNNHHAFAASAKFSCKPWEFDIGWMYIRALSALGLARVKRVPPRLVLDASKKLIDMDTLSAVITHRLHVMAQYTKLARKVYRDELAHAVGQTHAKLAAIKHLVERPAYAMNEQERGTLLHALSHSRTLETIYGMRLALIELWQTRLASRESLLLSLQQWCQNAEKTGIEALAQFAVSLRAYSTAPSNQG